MLVTAINLALTLATLTDYSEFYFKDAITNGSTPIVVPAFQKKTFQSTITVAGSAEPCPWRTCVNMLLDTVNNHTVDNSGSAEELVFSTPFRSGEATNTWQLSSSPFTKFTRTRTEWVHTNLPIDPKID